MTTTEIERLKSIRARCVELLAIAEKRTPGKWVINAPKKDDLPCYTGRASGEMTFAAANTRNETSEANATYIASCAGPAEAGWRATIATIDGMLHAHEAGGMTFGQQELCDDILTAWEGIV